MADGLSTSAAKTTAVLSALPQRKGSFTAKRSVFINLPTPNFQPSTRNNGPQSIAFLRRRVGPQPGDDRRQVLQHIIHLRLGVVEAEAEADAAARVRGAAAHGQQHVR